MSPALSAAVSALELPGAVELAIAPGDREAPIRWALALFGAESRPTLSRSRGGSPGESVRPLDREALLALDLFHPEPAMIALLGRAAEAGVVGRASRFAVVDVGTTPYMRIAMTVPLRCSHPLVLPPAVETIALSSVEGTTLHRCPECGASHFIDIEPNRPHEHDPPTDTREACRRCWEGSFTISWSEGYAITLVDETR